MSCFNSRCILQVVFHLFQNFLLGELFLFQVYSPSCFQPVSELLIGRVVSIPDVFSKLFSTSFWTSYWVSCFNSRCILQVVFHLFLNFLLGELFQSQVYSPSCFQPLSEILIGWVVSIPGVFSKLFSTCFWTSYWVSCFYSSCILQVVFNLFLNFLLGELFQFQMYSPSCFPPPSELLIGWVVSIPGVFSKLFSTCFWTSYWASCFNSWCILQVVFHLFLNFLLGELFQFQVYSPSCFPPLSELLIGWVVSIPGVFSKLFSTSFWTSCWVSCFNSRCILQVVFHLFLNFLLGELFLFQVYSPSCFQPVSEILIGRVALIPDVFSKLFSTSFWTYYWVSCFNSRCILQVAFNLFLNFLLRELFQFQVYSPSCFPPLSELLIGWVVSIPGVFSKLISTSFWTSCWVSCFNSRCILQVVFNLFLKFLLGELFQFQVYSPSCFPPVSELLIGWVVSIPGVFSKLFSTCFWTSYWASCFNSWCILQVVFHLFLNFLLGELFQFQVYSPSCFQPVSELLIGWVVSIPGVFSKLFSTCFRTSYWVSCFNSRCILQLFSTSFWTSYWVSCFNSRCILQVVFNLFLNFLLGELFQFQVYSPSCFPPVSELLIGWVVSIPVVFSKLFSTSFWTSYWASCFNSRCILQVVFHLLLNFLLGELFLFQVYSPSCFQPVSELLIGVSCFNSWCILQVVFHLFLNFLLGELFQFQVYSPSCFQPVSELLIGWVVSIPGVFSKLFSTSIWISYWVSCFNSRCILQVVFNLFLNFLLGELFQFQVYSPSCFQPVSEILIGRVAFNSRCILQVVFHLFLNFLLGELFQFQVYSPSCFQPVSELLIAWVVSIPGVFSKLFSTSFWTSYWVSCFNSRCILQVDFNLFLNFLLGELFQFQVYSPSCFQPVSELLIGWVVSIPGVFSKLFSTCFWNSYWVSCFNSRCILQVVFNLFLNFLLGELFQFQVYSPSCFQPVSELLIGWVVSIPGVFSKLFSTCFRTSYWVSCFNSRCILQLFSTSFWTSYWVSCFNSRCILQVVFNLFLKFLLGELFQFQVYSPSCFPPVSELLIGWVVSIPGVFSKLFSTCFWTSYWASCFNSWCILQVVFHLFLNFLLGELFQFQVYSPSCFPPLSELLIGWVVSIPGVFSKLFSTSFWTSCWVSCFNSRCILQVVFNLFLNFLLGELFQFQMYSPSCFPPPSELLIGWVVSIPGVFSKLFSTWFWTSYWGELFQFQVYSPSCFSPVSEHLIGWVVSIPGVFSKLLSTCFRTSYWVSCFYSSCILQVVFNLFLNFLLGELFQFQMYSPSCFPPPSELLIGWVVPGIETTHALRSSERGGKQLGEYIWNWNNSPSKKFRKRWKTTWRINLELKQLALFLNFLLGELL